MWRMRASTDSTLSSLRDGPRDQVRVELAQHLDERPVLLVALADDARAVRHAVQDVLGEHLEEGPLLLDDQDLLEALGELANDARLHRKEHAHLEDADAVAPQPLVVQSQLEEGLAHVEVGLARRHDAEPRAGRGHRDAVELVLVRVEARQLEPRVVERPLHVEPVGRDQVDVDRVLEGTAVQLDRGDDGRDAIRRDLGGARLIRDVRDDLDADPEPGNAREHEAVQPQVEDVLNIAREEGRHQRVVEGDLRVARERRGLGHRVIAGQGQHAAIASDAGVVGVLEGVARPVHARRLAVPHPEHAVVLRSREEPGHLAAEDGRGAEVFIQAGREHHVMRVEELPLALERLVEAAEGRAAA